ncbi:hypothetical protein HBI56_087570 [Parastagonospora nodorum]|nr:hypothetical protein HBH75_119500 [Parastagonospora nodorum]KAH4966655.1 hypothetical protein HBI78_084930 [Parastagonospora nodorum]KAH4989487.1 hypothetical protein HBI76_074360 [Parastagonospora nodorum]KAH5138959.1 hypothetical protein HBH70_098690 [Parastagonospora nodorum]KAH5190132.1 hypothetical protein HBH77_158060 [Parastagonospora nodorum]
MAILLQAATIAALASSVYAAPRASIAADCSPLPIGLGPVAYPTVVEDTPENFQKYEGFSRAALAATTPRGYVQSYTNMNSTYNDPTLFAGYRELTSYNVQKCAEACDSSSACNAFTIYAERNPVLVPGVNCPNPASTALIKCGLWQGTITSSTHDLNHGQYQQEFHVVMAGSNAYVKQVKFDTVPSVPGYNTDTYNNGGAIQAPLDCHGNNTYLGFRSWMDGRFDARRCTDVCTATKDCHFVNTYFLRDDDVPFAQHCSLYSAHWPSWYATNVGQYVNENELVINATKSYGFTHADGNHEVCEPKPKKEILDGM